MNTKRPRTQDRGRPAGRRRGDPGCRRAWRRPAQRGGGSHRAIADLHPAGRRRALGILPRAQERGEGPRLHRRDGLCRAAPETPAGAAGRIGAEPRTGLPRSGCHTEAGSQAIRTAPHLAPRTGAALAVARARHVAAPARRRTDAGRSGMAGRDPAPARTRTEPGRTAGLPRLAGRAPGAAHVARGPAGPGARPEHSGAARPAGEHPEGGAGGGGRAPGRRRHRRRADAFLARSACA
jgi:hypothetical protein